MRNELNLLSLKNTNFELAFEIGTIFSNVAIFYFFLLHACMHVCMYVCMYVCMSVCVCVCVCVCIYIYIYVYVNMYAYNRQQGYNKIKVPMKVIIVKLMYICTYTTRSQMAWIT